MKLGYLVAAAGFAVLASLPASADETLKTRLEAFAVSYDDAGQTIREPATEIAPGGIIEYHLSYENMSQAALGNFTVNGNIPKQTQYIAKTESVSGPTVFEAKVEGLDWAMPPIFRYVTDDQGVLRPEEIPVAEYTGLRWRLADPLAPGEVVTAVYRVKVNQ